GLGDPRFTQLVLSPDGARAVYVKHAELFSVALADGAPVKLDEPFVDDSHQISVAGVTAGSSPVGYLWFQDTLGHSTQKLCSAPIGGGASPTILEGPEYRALSPILLSPDGRWVVYNGGVLGLTCAAVDGSAASLRLPDAGGQAHAFRISADSTRVFFVWGGASLALYSVPIRRTSAPVLIAPQAPDAIEETPDGAHLVFLDDGAIP